MGGWAVCIRLSICITLCCVYSCSIRMNCGMCTGRGLVGLYFELWIGAYVCVLAVWISFWSFLTSTFIHRQAIYDLGLFCSNGLNPIWMQECFMGSAFRFTFVKFLGHSFQLINIIPFMPSVLVFVRILWSCCVFDWTRISTIIKLYIAV